MLSNANTKELPLNLKGQERERKDETEENANKVTNKKILPFTGS